MVTAFLVYDSAFSNMVAHAAYFGLSRRLVIENCDEFGDTFDDGTRFTIIFLLDNEDSCDGVMRYLKEKYQTEYVYESKFK